MNCKKCGNLVNNGSNYCTKCGTSVYPLMDAQNYTVKEQKKEFCTKCGTKNQGSRFCGNCGADLYQGHLEKKGGIGFLTDSAKNLSKNMSQNMSKNISADGMQEAMKEKIAELRKMDIKTTIKHGAVFAVCMLAFTLLFILIAQKAVNMLPVFQEEFWVKNSGLKDIKNYLLAAMYGIEVQHTGHIAATITGGVKIFPVLIGFTMIFVAISIVITKKVSGQSQKYNMPELVIFSLVNSVAVILCSFFLKTSAGIRKSEYSEFYEEVKLSLSTGVSLLNCLIMVFLVTLCLLIIANGIKLKQNEKNSTLLYAFRSNLIVVGAVLLSVVLITTIGVVKFVFLSEGMDSISGGNIETAVSALVPMGLLGITGFQSFHAAAAGFVSSMLVKVNGKDIIDVSLYLTDIKAKLVDLTLGKISNKWMMAVIAVLIVFILVRVVLDIVRILKHTNTEDIQTSAIELVKYSAGFAFITAFIANLFASYFKAKLNIPSSLEELSGYKILNGKSMSVSLGAGNPIGVFVRTFIFILAVSLITYWVVKSNVRIVDTYILAKKKLVMLAAVILVCLPAVSILFTSKEKVARMGSYESFMELVGSENIGEEEMERTLEKAGLNEEVLNEWNGVYGLMKELAGME